MGKNLMAVLLVTLFSVALAIGITYVVARGNSTDLSIQTPLPQSTGEVASTNSIGLPLVDNFTPTALPSENCTFPIDVWVQYPDAWKIETYRIGAKTYTKKEMVEILRSGGTDVRSRLLSQIFVLVLNQQNGADATNVRTAFTEAISWLGNFPPGSTPSDGDLQKANSIAKTLTSFNEGSLGPQTCVYDLAAATAVVLPGQQTTAGLTQTALSSATRSPIRIFPSETPQPREYVRPTRQPATAVPPTAIPPTAVPPTPIPNTPEPEITPVPTEAPPPPTDIPPPPPPPPPPPDPTVAQPEPTQGSNPPPPPPPQPTIATEKNVAITNFGRPSAQPSMHSILFANLTFSIALIR